jgi:hypothetical protein
VLFSRRIARYRANVRLQTRECSLAIAGLVLCLAAATALAEDTGGTTVREPAPATGKCQVVKNPFLTSCTPGRADSKKGDDWCGEHGSPESRCVICNPGLAKRD